MSKKTWILALAAATAVAGWHWQDRLGFPAAAETASPSQAKAAAEAVPVTTATAARRDLPVTLQGVGAIQAFHSVSVHPQVDGQLLRVAFKEGQQVQAGDLLGQIDPRSYQAALDQAVARRAADQALLANSRADLQRSAVLVEQHYVAQQAHDALRAKVDQLAAAVQGDEAAIQAARIQLEYTAIRTPIGGRAGIRQIDPSNILHAGGMDPTRGGGGGGDTLVVVTQMQPISVLFTLPQEELPRLAAAQARGVATVTVYGRDGGAPLDQGRLEVIDNQVDAATGTVRLKATLPNAGNRLWPGQFVTARLEVETRRQTVTVPSLAVQRDARGDRVYVATADGGIDIRPVVTGAVSGDTTEILDGVAEGETVVTGGHYRLRPGVTVAANPATSPTRPE